MNEKINVSLCVASGIICFVLLLNFLLKMFVRAGEMTAAADERLEREERE